MPVFHTLKVWLMIALAAGILTKDAEYFVKYEAAKQNAAMEAENADIRKVYLTFDDGPSANTDDILDILAAYDVKATLFVVGKEGEWAEEKYKRIVEEGHTLAMHSYSHDYNKLYGSMEGFTEDIEKQQNYLYEITGVKSMYFRFPGGSSNKQADNIRDCIAYLDEQGISYYDWNCSAQDATKKPLPAETIVENCMTSMGNRKNVIILLHDGKSRDTTVEALPLLIESIQELENTEILPISDSTVPVQHIKREEAN